MYKKVSTSLDFVEREKEIVSFWKENGVFEKSVEKNEGADSFFSLPTTYDADATGSPFSGIRFPLCCDRGLP